MAPTISISASVQDADPERGERVEGPFSLKTKSRFPRKPCVIHTYEEFVCNSFGMHTCKVMVYKSPGMNTYKIGGRGEYPGYRPGASLTDWTGSIPDTVNQWPALPANSLTAGPVSDSLRSSRGLAPVSEQRRRRDNRRSPRKPSGAHWRIQ
jgi:hypothetical protein